MTILTPLIYGVIAAFIFRSTTNPQRLRQTTNQILARILEFRLFVDEPSLIWRAQIGALKANLVLLGQIALPTLLMAAIFALIYPTLSRGPLPIGEATVLTAHTDAAPHIEGIAIETPGVRIPATGEVSWRIRSTAAKIGPLPSGVEIQYPRTTAWLLPFFTISSLTAIVISFLPTAVRRDR